MKLQYTNWEEYNYTNMQNTLVGSSEKRISKQSKCSHNLHMIEISHKIVTIKSRNMQWYIEVQYTEAEYKTKAWWLHNSDGFKTNISTICLHYALRNGGKSLQLYNM